jgi:hypothetical protein
VSRSVRVTLPFLFMGLIIALSLIGPACLNDAPTDTDAQVKLDMAHDGPGPSADLSTNADGGEDLAGADASKPILDFASGDLTGLVNCYNRAVCDPTTDFCITYNDGSQAMPGKTVLFSPACFAPDTPCADNGQQMDCNCIQNDGTLGLACQGSCVDNGDGTYVCYQN